LNFALFDLIEQSLLGVSFGDSSGFCQRRACLGRVQ